MTLKISRHVFGCRRGYRTLGGSADVTSAEREQLETFSFGQTNAAAYLDTLELNPAYWCHGLASGRWAVTRILKGAPDDKGRSTLLFVSALLDTSDWIQKLGADATPLLAEPELWAWDGQAAVAPVKIAFDRPEAPRLDDAQRARVLSMLALIEARYDAPDETVAASELEFSPDDIRALMTLLPHGCRSTFSYAVRSLSDGLPVRLNCLAHNASRGNALRKITRWSPHVVYSQPTYTAALNFFWRPEQPLPWGFVANCPSFGRSTWDVDAVGAAAKSTPTDSLPDTDRLPIRRRRAPWANGYTLLAVALSLLVVATALFIWRQKSLEAERALIADEKRMLANEVREFVKEHQLPVATAEDRNQCTRLMERADELAAKMSKLELPEPDEEFRVAHDALNEWLTDCEKLHGDRTRIEETLEQFAAFASSNGLEEFIPDSPYPSPQELDDVERWREDLELALERAAELSEHDQEAVAEAQEKLAAWDRVVKEIVQRSDTELGELRAFFDGPLPTELRTASHSKNAQANDMLRRLCEVALRMEPMLAESRTDQTESLDEDFEHTRKRAAEWEDAISRLRAAFNRHYGQAERLIRDHDLDLPDSPFLLSMVMERWAPANMALQRCEAALAVWPDHSTCLRDAATIARWIKRAAEAAHKQFEDDVEHACRVWEKEQKRATSKPAAGDGAPAAKPNPAGALGLIEDALRDYASRSDAIDHHDSTKRAFTRANTLKAELKPISGGSAED